MDVAGGIARDGLRYQNRSGAASAKIRLWLAHGKIADNRAYENSDDRGKSAMDFSIKACDWNEAANGVAAPAAVSSKTDCIVAGVFENGVLSAAAQALDAASGGLLSRLARAGEADGKLGTTLLLHEAPGIAARRVLLVGCGAEERFGRKAFSDAARAAWSALAAGRARSVIFTLAQIPLKDGAVASGSSAANGGQPGQAPGADDLAWQIRTAVITARELTYRFTEHKSKPEAAPSLEKVVISVDAQPQAAAKVLKSAKAALATGVAIANGVALTRDLGNRAPNVCTPTHLGETAKQLGAEFKLGIEVLQQKQIEALGMGAFLAVAKGSVEPPRFIVIKHNGGGKKDAPVVLVGKGITFDSGGISLKPGEAMDEMKYDMCGAATVLGTLRAVAEMKLPLNVIGIIASCENMPAGNATKPGDIVTTMSGKTVEILNTDAEGRLVLCDALTYAERFKPAAVIDIATLTGACIIALGHQNSGLFSTNDALAQELLGAARGAGDGAWRLPVEDGYQEQLKSNFADMANIGGRPAGSVTAACFLSRFTQAYPWAHLDIAGTAWKSGAQKGATGRPVPLLTQFLLERAGVGA